MAFTVAGAIAEAVTDTGVKNWSRKAAATYWPHLVALSERLGLPMDKVLESWDKISEEVEKSYPDDTEMRKFIRSTVILLAHTKPERV